ncbi:MAG: radical SAM protein [Oscillospiraceae bacterium]
MTQLCSICPRGCGVDRAGGQFGFCAVPDAPVVARAAPHFGEEPCISGTRGSGAVFFSGCNLRCVFCQNRTISRGEHGKEITVAQLRGIFLRLRDEGVHNINLVTPSHYTRQIAEALSGLELGIPVVWNSSGYECVETLRMLDGLVQVYLPDLKYALSEPAARYSAAADYPQVARAAILEMYRQTGPFRLDEDGMLQRGVLIRHHPAAAGGKHPPRHRLGRADIAPGQVLFSLMSQYTPVGDLAQWPELQHPISPELHEEMYQYLIDSPITDGFYQDLDAATGDMIPAFDGTGV